MGKAERSSIVLFPVLCILLLTTAILAIINPFILSADEPNGIYLNGAPEGFISITDASFQFIGYVRDDSAPVYVEIHNTQTDVYRTSEEGGGCTVEESETPGIWDVSCLAEELPQEDLYVYQLYSISDDNEFFSNLLVDYQSDIVALWNFDNPDWDNEVISNLSGTINGSLSVNNGILNATNGGYIHYVDEEGNFSFSGVQTHFKVEASVDSNNYHGAGNRIVGKYNEENNENTWLLGVYQGGVYCAIWTDGDQRMSLTKDVEDGLLVNGNKYIIGCEWNAMTRELTSYLRNESGTIDASHTEIVDGNSYIEPSTNYLTINGRATGGDGVNPYIDYIKIYSYPMELVDDTAPFLSLTDEFKYKTNLLTTSIKGIVVDQSTNPTVQMKRKDGDTWNSCTVVPKTIEDEVPDPIGVWKFEEMTGTVLDTSGNHNDAEPIGDVVYTPGIVGSAKYFDGDEDSFEIDDNINSILPEGSEPRTVAAWVKTETLNEWNHIFNYGEMEGNGTWGLTVYDDYTFGPQMWGIDPTAGNIPAGEWTHLAITLDEEGKHSFYQNGGRYFLAWNLNKAILYYYFSLDNKD